MRCGSCKGSHETVADVKACYADRAGAHLATAHGQRDEGGYKPAKSLKGGEDAQAAAVLNKMEGRATNGPTWPATDNQINYVMGLQKERVLPNGYTVKTEVEFRGMERDEVSAAITMMRDLPRKQGKAGGNWSMPAGRYALEFPGDDAKETRVRFFQIDKPTEGRWKGYTFIHELIGAPGDYRKQDMSKDNRDRMLRLIDANPNEAMTRFGIETMTCGKCHSPLTNEESRARGIGPVCIKKIGW